MPCPVIAQRQKVEEWDGTTPKQFRENIHASQRPAVLRGLVKDWALVTEGQRSADAIVRYLARFDTGRPVQTIVAPSEVNGRLFYRDDMSGFNFQRTQERITTVLFGLLTGAQRSAPPAISMQAIGASEHLRGIEAALPMPLVPSTVEPKLWIGNAVTVAPHFDLYDNIACVAAGRRQFILFPPEQVSNLYVGPFDVTPAGTPVSMVPLDEPDLEQYPRYRKALAEAQVAELGPGDAIYIPYMWWHGVKSLGSFNVLVNYWWNEATPTNGTPFDALLFASLVFRDMSPAHRSVWRTMFDYYVFGEGGDPMDHLPPHQRGSLGPLDARSTEALKWGLAQGIVGKRLQ